MEAFAAGCRGRMASTEALVLESGAAAFYGVRPAWSRLWQQAKAEGRDWYYIDNAFFDVDREQRFRVAKNCVQLSSFRRRDYPAFRGVIKPWRTDGEHIVVCSQSDEFMRTVIGFNEHWADTVCSVLQRYTTRPIIRRSKGSKASLERALMNAWAVVAHSSAVANEALLAGIPVFALGPCAASSMALSDLSRIENPWLPDGRAEWSAAVAAHQWTLAEMAQGQAWRALH